MRDRYGRPALALLAMLTLAFASLAARGVGAAGSAGAASAVRRAANARRAGSARRSVGAGSTSRTGNASRTETASRGGSAESAGGAGSSRSAAAAGAAGDDWPQFRGPHRDGVAAVAALLPTWPPAGPLRLWRVPIGEGYSHLAIAGGRLYTLFGTNATEYLSAFDTASGRQLWVQKMDAELMSDQGNGPRSTPTYDAGTLYVQTAQGRLHAVSAANGKLLWSHDLAHEYGARIPNWGGASSPLVEGDLLLVAAGGTAGHSAMAFDKHSGRVVWAALDEKPGYASPIAITAAGERQAIFFTGSSVSALAPLDGHLLWQVPWETDFDANAATPLFIAPDKVFVSSGYDTGAAVFQIHPAAAGGAGAAGHRLTVEPVWKSRVLKNQFSSTVLSGGYLYGFDNGTFKCVSAATGDERWKMRGLGHGSVIRAGNLLVVLSESGKLLLVDAAPEAYHERASFQALSGRCWTGPSLAAGKLFIRNGDSMAAFEVAASHP
jgi:outer membrane protein assembly factor BamB